MQGEGVQKLTAQDRLNLKTRHLNVDGIGGDRNILQSHRTQRLMTEEPTPMSEETSSIIRTWLFLPIIVIPYAPCGLPNAVV